MSNFKGNVAINSVSLWSMKTAMRLVFDKCTNFDQDDALVATAMFTTPGQLEHAASISDLCNTCLKHRDDTCNMYAIRFLRSFTRGPVEIRVGDWLLLTKPDDGRQYAAYVVEIAEVFIPGCSLMRINVSEVRETDGVDDTRGGVITVCRKKPPLLEFMVVNVEYVEIQELYCDARLPEQYTFTLMY